MSYNGTTSNDFWKDNIQKSMLVEARLYYAKKSLVTNPVPCKHAKIKVGALLHANAHAHHRVSEEETYSTLWEKLAYIF